MLYFLSFLESLIMTQLDASERKIEKLTKTNDRISIELDQRQILFISFHQ